ncbi:MAG: NAD(P)-dependent oxidoreductase [Candidatus Peregrinibacteria bacterium]
MFKKIPQTLIHFFEVDPQDKKLITKVFPEAKIHKDPLTPKNIPKDAEIICVMINSELTAKNLKKIPNLKLIVTRTVGYNHIDLKYAKAQNIPVVNVPDYGSHVIAEHVFALLLASVRNVLEGEEHTNKCKFCWKGFRGMALKGKTIGVVGTGKIGAHVCRIASQGFLMNVIAYDKYPNKRLARKYKFKYVDSLNDIWKKADVISLHVPLFKETEHMINAKTIKKMKDGVVLINTARGGLIDTPALIKAIKKHKFKDVALDVIEHEDNLKKSRQLLTLPGVIITPHIAFYADDSMNKMYEESINSIQRFIKKKKLIHQVEGE